MVKIDKRKFVISIMVITLMLLTLIGPNAHAGSLVRTYSGQFKTPWKLTATAGVRSTLEYGYNTFLINEDTAYGKYTAGAHYVKIQNKLKIANSKSVMPGSWARLEIQHGGNSVTYSSIWYD